MQREGERESLSVENKDIADCKLCNILTPEQHAQLVTPSYKINKEKQEANSLDTATPYKDGSSLVDPAFVSVIEVVGESSTVESPVLPPEKKAKKGKPSSKAKKRFNLLLTVR